MRREPQQAQRRITPASSTQVIDGFDPVFYSNFYSDVRNAFGTDSGLLYQHYVNYGKKEGRVPNAQALTGTGHATACGAAGRNRLLQHRQPRKRRRLWRQHSSP